MAGPDYPGTRGEFAARCTVSQCVPISQIAAPTGSHFDSTAAPRARGLLFHRLLEQAVETRPAPNRSTVGGGP